MVTNRKHTSCKKKFQHLPQWPVTTHSVFAHDQNYELSCEHARTDQTSTIGIFGSQAFIVEGLKAAT